MTDARLSAASMEHGTPAEAVEFVRHVLGGIDCDPFSSAYWNHYSVKAATFYDRAADGLRQPWSGRVIVNAPGADDEADTKSLVRPAWDRLVEHWRAGAIDGGLWVGYSVQQVGMLQGSPAHPLMLPAVFPCERFKFLRRPTREEPLPGGKVRKVVIPGPPVLGEQPTHYNFLTLLPSRRDPDEARAQVGRFLERGRSLGAVVRPAL